MPKVLEYLWLCIGLFSLGSGIYTSMKDGFGEGYLFFIITFIAAVFYGIRRKQRLNEEKNRSKE